MHRDDGLLYVDITMRAGRTNEQKKALYARIAELAAGHRYLRRLVTAPDGSP